MPLQNRRTMGLGALLLYVLSSVLRRNCNLRFCRTYIGTNFYAVAVPAGTWSKQLPCLGHCRGPLIVLGWSIGARSAQLLAMALQAAGLGVAALVMSVPQQFRCEINNRTAICCPLKSFCHVVHNLACLVLLQSFHVLGRSAVCFEAVDASRSADV